MRYSAAIFVCLFSFFLITSCERFDFTRFEQKPCENQDGLQVKATFPNGSECYVCSNSLFDFDTSVAAEDRTKPITFTLTNVSDVRGTVYLNDVESISLDQNDDNEYKLTTEPVNPNVRGMTGIEPGGSVKFLS